MMRAQARHRRFALTSDSKRVLKKWFEEHIEHPYPTQREKDLLARQANLSLKQINDWCASTQTSSLRPAVHFAMPPIEWHLRRL